MYKNQYNQLEFEDFALPFSGKLRSDNRWIKMAKFIPWEELEPHYTKSLSGSKMGSPALSARIAIGSLIIKERLGTTDEETVEQIRENPFLQYFLGFKEYQDKKPFDPSMLVHFRKRIDKQELKQINETINQKALLEVKKASTKKSPDDKDDDAPGSGNKMNKGKLIVDATCTPADITFPTDLKILNVAREKSEEIIDVLHGPLKGKQKKPRTYRKTARKDFLSVAKSKKLSRSKRRKAIRRQLGYLGRNLKTIAKQSIQTSLTKLSKRQYKDLLVIHEVYRQQKLMYDNRENRVNDRIVSISQPHVRPIKRGKSGVATEFGAKISASLVDGFVFLDRISWDAYNESHDLEEQIRMYHDRLGFYPESVHADKIYRTRNNRKFCQKHGIRLSGPPLGRPPKEIDKNQVLQEHQDELDRIPIEGKFGQGKRRFSLSKIMCKLAQTSETAISICFIVMNLERWLKAILFWLINCLFLLPLESSVGALNRIRERCLSFDRAKFTLIT
jgi:transposase, IS5 family